MNDDERHLVDELRSRVKEDVPEDWTDFDFVRWLRGFDRQLDVIEPRLRHHMRFRNSYDFKTYAYDRVLRTYWPQGVVGFSGKDDNLVLIECTGRLDGEGVMRCRGVHEIMIDRFCYIEAEIWAPMRSREKETGRISGLIYIFDLDQAPLTPKVLALMAGPFKLFLNILLLHCVELVNKTIIINAPSFLELLFRLVRPILPEKTRQRIVVLGVDWKTELLKYVDTQVLPVQWGGTSDTSKVVVPSPVPPELFWTPSDKEPPSSSSELSPLVVPAGGFRLVTFKVEQVGCRLRWHFFTKSDFGFGVFFTEDEEQSDTDQMQMVFPQFDRMHGPTAVPERHSILCKAPGYYRLWFGNRFSWINKLHVNYKIWLDESSHCS